MNTFANPTAPLSASRPGRNIFPTPSTDGNLPLSSTDTIYVSAVQYGKTLLDRVTLTGCATVAEILNAVRALLGHVEGLVNVSFRNRDNGWRSSRAIRVSRPSMSMLAMA